MHKQKQRANHRRDASITTKALERERSIMKLEHIHANSIEAAVKLGDIKT